MKPSVLAVVAVLVLTRQSAAFEADEHEWVSNAAICIALADPDSPLNSTQRDEAATKRATLLRSELGALTRVRTYSEYQCSDAVQASYGQIVAYADFTRSPALLLESDGDGRTTIHSCQVLRKLNQSFLLAGAGETLNNPHHFRGHGLAEYATWHEHALLLAEKARASVAPRQAGELRRAIVLNAYADHFLEDSFAPGHAVVNDVQRGHVDVLRVHDIYNAAGLDFEVNRSAADKLLALVDSRAKRERVATCFSAGAAHEDLVDAATELHERGLKERVRLVGDHSLYRGSVVSPDVRNAEQALLLGLIVSLSIRDVATAFVGSAKDPPDPVFKNKTCGCEREPGSHLCKSLLGDTHDDDCFAAGSDTADFYTQNAIGYFPRPEAAEHAASGEQPHTPEALYLRLVPALSYELQRVNDDSRKNISLDLVYTSDHSLWDGQRLEYTLGGTLINGDSYDGYGVDIGFFHRHKGLGIHVGPQLGYRFLSAGGDSYARPHAVLRGGLGIGLVTLFGAWGLDASIMDGRPNQDWGAWSLGVTGSMSFDSIYRQGLRPLWNSVCDCWKGVWR